VFHGSVDELLAAQRSELLAIPEHADDLSRLAALCIAAGKPAQVEGQAVRVDASEDWAAELNRRAMAAGITLRGIQSTRGSLEDAFFSITDQSSAGES
jgi:ABC-2 type transport system ATP-binding protein